MRGSAGRRTNARGRGVSANPSIQKREDTHKPLLLPFLENTLPQRVRQSSGQLTREERQGPADMRGNFLPWH